MTVVSILDHGRSPNVRVRTDTTIDVPRPQTVCVPTPADWPHAEFVAWLDATKERFRLTADAHLAERLGIGRTLIVNWRRGVQRPSWEILVDVAHALGEDVRPLWVLAGLVSREDVGLVDETDHGALQALPREIQQLIEVYADRRMDVDDRAAILRAVRMVYQGVLADLSERERPAAARPARRRAG